MPNVARPADLAPPPWPRPGFGIGLRAWRRTWRRAACLCALLAAAPIAARATEPAAGASPAGIKAAFIYNFTKFIDWPATRVDANETFDIVVLGAPDVEASLRAAVAGMRVANRPIAVRRLTTPDSLATAAAGVEILYVGEAAADSMPQWRQALGPGAVLTIGDSDAFWKGGGAIRFLVQEERMRFRVNLRAADSRGLKMSSRLLALALAVEVDGPR